MLHSPRKGCKDSGSRRALPHALEKARDKVCLVCVMDSGEAESAARALRRVLVTRQRAPPGEKEKGWGGAYTDWNSFERRTRASMSVPDIDRPARSEKFEKDESGQTSVRRKGVRSKTHPRSSAH